MNIIMFMDFWYFYFLFGEFFLKRKEVNKWMDIFVRMYVLFVKFKVVFVDIVLNDWGYFMG